MKYLLLFITFLMFPLLSFGAEPEKSLEEIKADIQKTVAGIQINKVEKTPIPGLYQVSTAGSIAYMSADGRYIVTGDLYDKEKNINMTEALMGGVRKERLDGIGNDGMLVYKAEGEEKHVLTVFTDTSCGYCRKLHKDIPSLNKDGITVRYMLYPRMGIDSQSASVMESVWCAKDRLQAMTDAKSGKGVATKNCVNPVQEHYAIGQEFGLRGTPMLVTQNGDVLPGYYPPAALKQRIGVH